MSEGTAVSYTLNVVNQRLAYITIHIHEEFVDKLFHEASCAQQAQISTYGFARGCTPLEYIQEHYKNVIIEHIIEFCFKYFIINFLYDILYMHKLCISGEPRLYAISLELHAPAQFVFELSLVQPLELVEWKYLPFKASRRKNYKDIDRQVDLFIQEEQENAHTKSNGIEIGDWICLDISLLDKNHNPLFGPYQKHVWLKIGNEEADLPFQELLCHASIGSKLISSQHCLQEYFSQHIDTNYTFGITVCQIVPYRYFCFEDFKYHFRLKNNKEIHQKLIEIFSYRNDLSQRRNIVEEALRLLTSKHNIDVPGYLILRQQKKALENLQQNPDYQVYKTQGNFQDTIRALATKQVKEMIIMDQIAFNENIQITDRDIKAYLNFFKRPRTKEFIYFQPPSTKIDGQEIPVPSALIKQSCLREKTLNTVIYHLTRK